MKCQKSPLISFLFQLGMRMRFLSMLKNQRFLTHKKGVELGINFIVILILAIAVFILGLGFIFSTLNNVENLLKKFEPQINSQLEEKIANGEIVAIYPSTLELRRGQKAAFGVAVFNEQGTAKDFQIEPAVAGIDPPEATISPGTYVKLRWAGSTAGNMADAGTIQPNQYNTRLFLVTVNSDAPSGTYIIDVIVFSGAASPYGGIKKVWVTVP